MKKVIPNDKIFEHPSGNSAQRLCGHIAYHLPWVNTVSNVIVDTLNRVNQDQVRMLEHTTLTEDGDFDRDLSLWWGARKRLE